MTPAFDPIEPNFVICVTNAGYAASLEVGQRYRMLPDPSAAAHNYVRVIDESGEDYLYPESYFIAVEPGQTAEETP